MKDSLARIVEGIKTISKSFCAIPEIKNYNPGARYHGRLRFSSEGEKIEFGGAVRIDPSKEYSAHDLMQIAALKSQALSAGKDIYNALQRFTLLNTPDLTFRVFVYPPNTPSNTSQAPIINIKIGYVSMAVNGLPIEKLERRLERFLTDLENCPPGALCGPLRQFTINKKFPLIAPSPEAAVYLWFLSKRGFVEISEHLDPEQVLAQLDMFKAQAPIT